MTKMPSIVANHVCIDSNSEWVIESIDNQLSAMKSQFNTIYYQIRHAKYVFVCILYVVFGLSRNLI